MSTGLKVIDGRVVLKGRLWLKRQDRAVTAGKFRFLVEENRETFKRYFGNYVFPGSLNVHIEGAQQIAEWLDSGELEPAFIIPHGELTGQWNPRRLGDGQAWRCRLESSKLPGPVDCWVFRRLKSKVPPGVIEILAVCELVKPHGLAHNGQVTLTLFEGP